MVLKKLRLLINDIKRSLLIKVTSIGWLIFFPFLVQAGTFLETFDDGVEGWQEFFQHDVPPGSWEIIDFELRGVNNTGLLHSLTTGDETWRDYTIEFDVKPLKKHRPGGIAIAARINRTSSMALWCIIGDSIFPIAKHEARTSCFGSDLRNLILRLSSENSSLLELKKWSTLKLSVQGNNLTFWINGKMPLDRMKIPVILGKPNVDIEEVPEHLRGNFVELDEFPDFFTGGAGFGLSGYTALFDNIIITGNGIPNRGGLSVAPGAKLATTWGNLKRF